MVFAKSDHPPCRSRSTPGSHFALSRGIRSRAWKGAQKKRAGTEAERFRCIAKSNEQQLADGLRMHRAEHLFTTNLFRNEPMNGDTEWAVLGTGRHLAVVSCLRLTFHVSSATTPLQAVRSAAWCATDAAHARSCEPAGPARNRIACLDASSSADR